MSRGFLESPHGKMMCALADTVARSPQPSRGAVFRTVLEEFGEPPPPAVMDYFLRSWRKQELRGDLSMAVLLVDNTLSGLQKLEKAAGEAKLRALVAGDGNDAWNTYEENEPAMVMVEAGVEGLSCQKLVTRIRDREGVRHTYILAFGEADLLKETGRWEHQPDNTLSGPIDVQTVRESLSHAHHRLGVLARAGLDHPPLLPGKTLAQSWNEFNRENQPATQAAREHKEAPLVLVVEDSTVVNKMITRTLLARGFRVETAHDGMDALIKMGEARPDLVLLDIDLPRMTGLQVKAAMQTDDALSRVPVILMSSSRALVDQALEKLGPDTVYLEKPIPSETLADVVEKHINN